MKKQLKQFTSCLLAFSLAITPVVGTSHTNTARAASVTHVTSSPARVSVHDPSVAVSNDGTYYVFGSHITAAKSNDLVNWHSFANGYAETNNVIFGNLSSNLKKPFAWAGENDCDSQGGFSVWAPDVIWNSQYVNTDGTKGAYMMYFCTSSTYMRSVIAYGVSQNIEGPYNVVDTVIYSGFTKDKAFDNGSLINTKYTNTNIGQLIDNGTLKDGVNSKWFSYGSYNTSYAPNAIDPTVFYDKDGKLWMTYGSWSGGIYVLEINPQTGKAIYPGKNSTTKDGLIVDEYFGTRIAGGYTKSGEGPYILYDKTSDYYYLYMTYEGLAADGGYNMRLFRSKSPNGPFVDAAGNNAALSGDVDHNNIGIKVMGNYTFSCLSLGYRSPGHNSAFIDNDNQRYLIYHTRFSDDTGIHQVRVHQQFLNQEGWPVTAVFENKGDTISQTGYDKSDIVGSYEFINHGTTPDYANVKKPQTITLNADGTISGSIKGTWEEKSGTYYMNAAIGNTKYSGVFFLQNDESSESVKVMTFTAIGNNNETIWGVRKEAYKYTDSEILDRASSDLDNSLKIVDKTTSNITLPKSGFKSCAIAWESSNTAVISNTGVVTRPSKDTTVSLTATIKSGTNSVQKTYNTTVLASEISPDYCYDFESINNKEVKNTGTSTEAATLQGNASIRKDSMVGNVLSLTNKEGSSGKNYLKLPSTMFSKTGNSGFTVNMWTKFSSSTSDQSTLFEARSSSSNGGVPVISLNVSTAPAFETYDASINNLFGLTPECNKWVMVTYVVSQTGISVYTNGKKMLNYNADLTSSLTPEILSKINDIRIGSSSSTDNEDVRSADFDNFEFYAAALSSKDISNKYVNSEAAHPNFSVSSTNSTLYVNGDAGNTATFSTKCSSKALKYTSSYSSSNNAVASISSTGRITAKKAGSATITAKITANSNTISLSKKITVKKAYLKFTSKKQSIKIGKHTTFKLKGYGLKTSSIKWTSSNPAVLMLKKSTSSSVSTTAKKAGSATITASYKGFKVTAKVTVKK